MKSIKASSSPNSWTLKSKVGSVDYKSIILAAPFHQSHITVPSSISEQIPEQPYVHLHVTLLTTTSEYPNPAYYGLPAGSKVPRMMLTTAHGEGKVAPEFNSLSYHGLVREGEWAVKIFSDHVISDEWLANMFNGQVGWVFRKEVCIRYHYQPFQRLLILTHSGMHTPNSLPPPPSLLSSSTKASTTSTPSSRTSMTDFGEFPLTFISRYRLLGTDSSPRWKRKQFHLGTSLT